MWLRGKAILVLGSVLAVAASLAIAGCGGGSSSTESSADSAPSGNLSKQFLGPKGENSQAKFGQEGTSDELAEAASVVEENITARSKHEWAAQCATLSKKTFQTGWNTPTPPNECAAKFKSEGRTVLPSILKNNMEGPVVALRVKGNTGYALFHGNDKKDWAMKVEREGGEWKVAALLPEELKR